MEATPVGYVVVIKRDGTDGPKFAIEASTNNVTFGRDEATDIRVQLPGVGLKHCQLNINDGKITLENFSDNLPTKCNRVCVEKEKLLAHNDVFSIAHRSFRIEYTKPFEKASPNKENYKMIPFGTKSMTTDSISPMRNNTKLHHLDCTDSKVSEKINMLPLRVLNKDNNAPDLVTNTPKSLLKRTSLSTKKRVSFGVVLSPEYFDKRLPPSTPIRRGASPAVSMPPRSFIHRTPLFPDYKDSTFIESNISRNTETQTSNLDNVLLSFDSESNKDIFDDSPTTKSKLPAPIQAEVIKSWKNNLLPSVNEEQESHISPNQLSQPLPNRFKKRALKTPLRKEIQSKPSLRKTLRKGLMTPLRKQIIQGVTLKKTLKRTIKISNIDVTEIAAYPNNNLSKNKDLTLLNENSINQTVFQFDLSNQKLRTLEQKNVSLCEVNNELHTPLKNKINEGLLLYQTKNKLKTPLRNEIEGGKSLRKTKKKLQTPLRKQIKQGLPLRQTRRKLQTPLRNQIQTRISLRKTVRKLQTPLKTQISEGLLLRQTMKKLQTPLRYQIQGGMSLNKSMKKLQTPLRVQIGKGLTLRQTKKKLQTPLRKQIQGGLSLRQTMKKLQTPLKNQIGEGILLRQTKKKLQTPLRKQIQGGMSLRQTMKKLQTPLKNQISERILLRQTKKKLQTPLRKQIQGGMSLRQTMKKLQTPLKNQIGEGILLRQTKKKLQTPLRKQIQGGLSLRKTMKKLQTPLKNQIGEGILLRQTKKKLQTPLRKQIQGGLSLRKTMKKLQTPLKNQIGEGILLRQTKKKLQTPLRKQIQGGMSLRQTMKKLQTPLKNQISEGILLRQTKKKLQTPLRKQIQGGMSLRQTMKKLQTPLKNQIGEGILLRQTKKKLQTPLRKQIQGGISLRQTMKKLQTPLKNQIGEGILLRQTKKKLQTPLRKQIQGGLSLRQTMKKLQTPLKNQINKGILLRQTRKKLQTPLKHQISEGILLRQTMKKLQTPLRKQIQGGMSLRQTMKKLQTPLKIQINEGILLRQTKKKLETPLRKQIQEGTLLKQTMKKMQTPLKKQINEGYLLRQTMKNLQKPLKNQISEGILLRQTKKKLQTPLRKQIEGGKSLRQIMKKLQTPLKKQIGERLLLRQTKKKLQTPLKKQISVGLSLRHTKKKLQTPLKKQIQAGMLLKKKNRKLPTPLQKEICEGLPLCQIRKNSKTLLINQNNGNQTNVCKILKAQQESSEVHQESSFLNSDFDLPAEVPIKSTSKSSIGKHSRKGKVSQKKSLVNEKYTSDDNGCLEKSNMHSVFISDVSSKYNNSAFIESNAFVENDKFTGNVMSADNSVEDCVINNELPIVHLISVTPDLQSSQVNKEKCINSVYNDIVSMYNIKDNDYLSDASNSNKFVEYLEVETMFKNSSAKDLKFGESISSKSFLHDIRDLPSPTFENSGSNFFNDIENSLYAEQSMSIFTRDMLDSRNSFEDGINTSVSDSVSEDVSTYQILSNVHNSEAMVFNLPHEIIPDTILHSKNNISNTQNINIEQLLSPNKKADVHPDIVIYKEKGIIEKITPLNIEDEVHYQDVIINKENSFIEELISLNKEDEVLYPGIIINKEKCVIDDLVSLNREVKVCYPDIILNIENPHSNEPIRQSQNRELIKNNENKAYLIEQPKNQINESNIETGQASKCQEFNNTSKFVASKTSSKSKKKNLESSESLSLAHNEVDSLNNISATGITQDKKKLDQLKNSNKLPAKESISSKDTNDQLNEKPLEEEKISDGKLKEKQSENIKVNDNQLKKKQLESTETSEAIQSDIIMPGRRRKNVKIVVDFVNQSGQLQSQETNNIRRSARSNQTKSSDKLATKGSILSKDTNDQLNEKPLEEEKISDGKLKEKQSENIKVNDIQLEKKQLENTVKSEALQSDIIMPGRQRKNVKNIVDFVNQSELLQPEEANNIRRSARSNQTKNSDKLATKGSILSKDTNDQLNEKPLEEEKVSDGKLKEKQSENIKVNDIQLEKKQLENTVKSEALQSDIIMPGRRRKNVKNVVDFMNQSELLQPEETNNIRRSARSNQTKNSDKLATKGSILSKDTNDQLNEKPLEEEKVSDGKLKEKQSENIKVNDIQLEKKQLENTVKSEALQSDIIMPGRRRKNVKNVVDFVNQSELLQPEETNNIRRSARSNQTKNSDKLATKGSILSKDTNDQLNEKPLEEEKVSDGKLKEKQSENIKVNDIQLEKKQLENTVKSEALQSDIIMPGRRRKNVKNVVDFVNQSELLQPEETNNIRRSARSNQTKNSDKLATKGSILSKDTNDQLNKKPLEEEKVSDGKLKEKQSENIKVNDIQLEKKQLENTVKSEALQSDIIMPGRRRKNVKNVVDFVNQSELLQPEETNNIKRSARSNQTKNSDKLATKGSILSKDTNDQLNEKPLEEEKISDGKLKEKQSENIKVNDNQLEKKHYNNKCDTVTSEALQSDIIMPGRQRKNVKNVVDFVNQSEPLQPEEINNIRRSTRSKQLQHSDIVSTKELVSFKQINIVGDKDSVLKEKLIGDNQLNRNQFDNREINERKIDDKIFTNDKVNGKENKDTLTRETSFCTELIMLGKQKNNLSRHNKADPENQSEKMIAHNIRCTRSKQLQNSDQILKNELVTVKETKNIYNIGNNEQLNRENKVNKLLSISQQKAAQQENELINNYQLVEKQLKNKIKNDNQLKRKQFENKVTNDNQMNGKDILGELNIPGKRRRNINVVNHNVGFAKQMEKLQAETLHCTRRSARTTQEKTEKFPTKELTSTNKTGDFSEKVDPETDFKNIHISVPPVMNIENVTYVHSARSMKLKRHETKLKLKMAEQNKIKKNHSIDLEVNETNGKSVVSGKISEHHDEAMTVVENDYDKKNAASPSKKNKLNEEETSEYLGSKLKMGKIMVPTTRSSRRKCVNGETDIQKSLNYTNSVQSGILINEEILPVVKFNQSNNTEVEPGSAIFNNNIEDISWKSNSESIIQAISQPSTRSRKGKNSNQTLIVSNNISLETIQTTINDVDVTKITKPSSKLLKGKKKFNALITDTTQAKNCVAPIENINKSLKEKPNMGSDLIMKKENSEKDSKTQKYRSVVDNGKSNRRKR
ncbi:uncharacterized protein LOC100205951 isoform X3 [Hydra vulgaris]|uniref:Uncharacterized protein LOC100205951 isoform X3 n=1 Tax=Hydra vulgaris TaxID=6087 RepID=A0ABM4BHD9_HYDVU